MNELMESIMFQLRLVRTYIFRKLFKGEARLIDNLMADNNELTRIATEQVQTIFEKESQVQTLEYQLEDAEVKIESLREEVGELEAIEMSQKFTISNLEYSRDEAEAKVSDLEDDVDRLSGDLDDKNWEIDSLKNEHNALEVLASDLEYKIHELEQEVARLEYMNEEF